MADDGHEYGILQDLQVHLKTARVPLENLSTLAQDGDEKKGSFPGAKSFTNIILLLIGSFNSLPPADDLWRLAADDFLKTFRPKEKLFVTSNLLVEQFLTENVKVGGKGPEVIQSQLYIACFWGIRDAVETLLKMGADANHKNKGTMWTPLHAATFQDHGPLIMMLLEHGANPESPDSFNRTPVDFASASDKIWPHFAVLGYKRVTRAELVEKHVLKPISSHSAGRQSRPPGHGIQMASYDRNESKYEYNSDPFIHAVVTGDVLADQGEGQDVQKTSQNPQFSLWR